MTVVLSLIDRRSKATDWRDGSIIIPTPLGLADSGGGWWTGLQVLNSPYIG